MYTLYIKNFYFYKHISISFHENCTKMKEIGPRMPVANLGFTRRGGGGGNFQGGAPTYYLAKFFPKTEWKWKNLDPEGGGSLVPP